MISVPLNVTIIDNNLFETDKRFNLIIIHGLLPDRVSRGNRYQATVTIEDDECK